MSQPRSHCDSPPGTPPFPLVDVEGTAFECGRQYRRIVIERYPGYRRYLDMALDWRRLSPAVRRLVESRAPYLLDLYGGLNESAGSADGARTVASDEPPPPGGCTSFGAGCDLTGGTPLAGQNKDTALESLRLYIVLRMRIAGGPTMLVLAYPGEVLGYGLWSTGMSLFRNSLFSSGDAPEGLTMVQWGLLALAGGSVPEAAELARRHGIAGSGNCLITDAGGQSASVEFNAGGVDVLPARTGLCVHANHPEGPACSKRELYPDAGERENSRYRAEHLRELLERQRGRLSPAGAIAALGEHSRRARGLCRHVEDNSEGLATTASVLAQPAEGILHVVSGPPCRGRPVEYRIAAPGTHGD